MSVLPPCQRILCGRGNGSFPSWPMWMIRTVITSPGSHSACSNSIRAAALDSEEPIGKSLGLGRLFIDCWTLHYLQRQRAVGLFATVLLNPEHPPRSFRHQTAEPLHFIETLHTTISVICTAIGPSLINPDEGAAWLAPVGTSHFHDAAVWHAVPR